MQGENGQRPYKGLFTDVSKQDQPKDTYTFALNAVNESDNGNLNLLGNEESNEICGEIKDGYTLLGKVYIGDNETVLFSVSKDEKVSEIGILKENCEYETHVNDAESPDNYKLGFKATHQIQAVYRLRRGCDKTIYFTDNLSQPRYYNFNSPEDFKSKSGLWNKELFNLQKQYTEIPEFQSVEVLDSGGNLEPGGYSIAIQYVDGSLNPTEWITTSPVINIYNDLSSKEYREINGSIKSDEEFFNYPATSKALRVQLNSLDTNFSFYRLAFIESTSGSGFITDIKYTDVIPTSKNFFIYTGQNVVGKGTEVEIAAFSEIIGKANSIEQIENRLLLANTEGKQVDYCKLQKFASRIKADCITKTVNLSDLIDPANPKNPTHQFGGRGYMPGEIYSFAIVYIFADNTLSPAFHIPGKSPLVNAETVFSPTTGVYPMSKDNNISSTYVDNTSCGGSFWGKDSQGSSLVGKSIRHHRFPLRSEIGVPLIKDQSLTPQDIIYYNLDLKITGTLITPVDCPTGTPECGTDNKPFFEVRVRYKVEGEDFSFTQLIDPAFYADGTGTFALDILEKSQFHPVNTFTDIKIDISDIDGEFHALTTVAGETTYTNDHGAYFDGSAEFKTSPTSFTATTQDRLFSTEILGIKFSDIDIPILDNKPENKIIGYYIVRNERTEFDKTILDSGVLVPSTIYKNYISHGLLQPESDDVSKTVFGVIHPEHKFNEKEYTQYDEIIQEGNFKVLKKEYGKIAYNDVFDGSSIGDKDKDTGDDGKPADGQPRTDGYDGWSLEVITRDNIVTYEENTSFRFDSSQIEERFYLDALGDRAINAEANNVWNITTDNKIGIIQLKDGNTIERGQNLPYVVFKKQNLDSYSNFRTLPYYKETVNPVYFDENNPTHNVTTIFNGDSYVSPMRYVNSVMWDNRVAKRKGKTSVWKWIAGIALIVIGAVLAIFSGGASTPLIVLGAGLLAAGGGALLLSSGIKQAAYNKAYMEEYDKGLRLTALDRWVDTFYRYTANVGSYFPTPWTGQTQHAGKHAKDGPMDDTIQWIGECVTDLWFESTINTSLRVPLKTDLPSFLDAPGKIESGNNSPISLYEFFKIYYASSNQERYPVSSFERHMSRKLLMFNGDRNDNREYIGLALGELYKRNPDYTRENKQKFFYHLPLEFDCCSDCQEKFPHRIYYSEQSFQEELSDNYKIFLPNNYKDIQGETGGITDIFKISNNLFIHTFEGLWQMPRNYQERVTDQIVSFIGTGSYFEIPPQKILDDDTGLSAGLQHKWAAIKTPYGRFFVSANQKVIYQFDGAKLTPISSSGISAWAKENIGINIDRKYENSTKRKFPFRDNPSNKFGSGFILSYDSRKERILVTKKDNDFLQDLLLQSRYEITSCNGELIIFNNFQNTIDSYVNNGYKYEGIENCQMVFSHQVTRNVETIEYIWIEPLVDISYNTYFEGVYPENDPIHPLGGWVEFESLSGGIIHQDYFVSGSCDVVQHKGIIDYKWVIKDCLPEEKITTIIRPGYYEEHIKMVPQVVTEYVYVDGVIKNTENSVDNSWTLSYSLKNNSWISWHSYLPNFYINTADKLYSWKNGLKELWKHNSKTSYQTFYNSFKAHILEYVSSSSPITNLINSLRINTTATKYDLPTREFSEKRFITFNKGILYNSRQCSGLLNFIVKDTQNGQEDYLLNQIVNTGDNSVIIDRNETDWTLNDLRDIRIDYDKPIWNSNINALQDNYFIDKILNESTLDINKDWTQLENFRDKYLVVRLIFDNFANTKLVTNFTTTNEQQSFR